VGVTLTPVPFCGTPGLDGSMRSAMVSRPSLVAAAASAASNGVVDLGRAATAELGSDQHIITSLRNEEQAKCGGCDVVCLPHGQI
jgi:hypothetical protein